MGEIQTQTLTSEEQIARVRLIRTNKIGPATFQRLLQQHGSADNALDYVTAGQPRLKIYEYGTAVSEFEAFDRIGGHFLFLGHSNYPERLAAIPGAPPVLTVKGNLKLATAHNIGVVGARNASASGLKLTKIICADLSKKDIVINSGLARGIDTQAHMASLEGGTIACLAGGLDIVYPQENQRLYDQIAEQGLLVSEMPIGTKPQARHFPRRNRLISGLSEGLLVIEAAKKSGSLITARFAAEQGRDVFSVPGSPLDPRAQGTNQLIKDGAILTQSAQDILDELQSMPLLRASLPKVDSAHSVSAATRPPKSPPQTNNSHGDLLSYLSPAPIHIDEIVRLSGRPTHTVLGEFISLELNGKIIRHAGNKFSRNSSKNE